MSSKLNNARVILMAGGRGTRLLPLTTVLPKPLLPLGDKAILEILLGQLKENGFHDVTICTGYLKQLIMVVAGDGSKFGMNIDYHSEESPLGTAGAIAGLDNLTDPFIVMNGDLLTSLNYGRMYDYHQSSNADLTIGVYFREVKIDFGVVKTTESGEFEGFDEKPVYPMRVSMGVNVLAKSVIDLIPKGSYMDMPDLVKAVHSNGGKIACYEEDCYWLDIGRMDDYALAQEQFENNSELFGVSSK